MKLNFDIKNKIGSVEADVEKLVEKGMDNHEKDWKEKHEAKKELIELKHKNKMEQEDQKQKRVGFFEKRAQEKERLKQLEFEQEQKELEEERKERKLKIILGTILVSLGLIIAIISSIIASGKEDSPIWGVFAIGLMICCIGPLLFIEPKKKRKKRK